MLQKKVAIQYVPTENQKADILTKALPAHKFENLRAALNVVCASQGCLSSKNSWSGSVWDVFILLIVIFVVVSVWGVLKY